QQKIQDYLSSVSGVPREVFAPHLQLRQGQEAGLHLCQVASGLDSMILGEPQIQGQVATAYQLAMAHHSTGTVLNALFRAALHSGKRARTETAISKHATSISHAAVELASQIFDDLAQKCILLIGAGEMAELAAKNLVDNGVADLLVVNRSPGRAASLAQKFGGEALKWERLTQALCQADIVISSTSAPHAILTRENVATAMHVRRNRPLFLIDIAVPRDIEPAVGELSNAFVYDIDDLQQVVKANLEQRQREIPHVQAIVEAEMKDFMAWFRALDVVPTIVDLRQHAERVRQAELERAMRRLDHLSEQEQKVVAALSRRIVNKILHQPTTRLKQRAKDCQAHSYVAAIRDLFELSAEHAPEEKERSRG
ncbi:MAG: glutamyl-tRNA reductase, partial [Delftia sp.]|nr:glutamyl-tRNA reductase [Delftia sp.]